jgi:hypothetical protein
MAETLFIIGFIIDIIGELILATSIIMVHGRVLEEKKIDKKVFRGIRREIKLGILAMIMIIIGSGMQFSTMF